MALSSFVQHMGFHGGWGTVLNRLKAYSKKM
jgi:hypothetical protein